MSYLKGKNKPQGGAIGQHRARRSRRPVCRNLNFRAAAGTRLLPEVIATRVSATGTVRDYRVFRFSQKSHLRQLTECQSETGVKTSLNKENQTQV